MINLSDRQVQILKAIIEEYMETAMPVGSEILDRKYNLGISPATIRNEMVVLTKEGFLNQPHISAGRVPTPMALKFYVNQLMEERDLSVTDEATVKGKIWDYKNQLDRLFHEITKVLSDRTKSLALVSTERGDLFHAGYANILEEPEFFDIDVAKTVLSLIDDFNSMNKFFNQALGEGPIHILLGDDFGMEFLEPCGLIFVNFQTKKVNGSLGVFGSCRLDYASVIPNLKYLKNLIEEIGNSW